MSDSADTRCRILDAAERLFADRGIDAISIRDITQAAKVNLAAVNYHFQNKKGMVTEVFGRRLQPINERRLVLLSEAEAAAAPDSPRLRAVVEALVRPVVETGFEANRRDEHFMRLMGRCIGESNDFTDELIFSYYEEMMRRFEAAFLRAVPSLDVGEVFWRFKFTMGSLHHALLTCGMVDKIPSQARKRLNAEHVIERLVRFLSAGWMAPITERSE